MTPRLHPGDRLLVDYRRDPRPGDVVVVRLPDGTVAAKRAAGRRPTAAGAPAWWLTSDNPAVGIDSRHLGPVRADEIQAVVVVRVWPWGRRRAVPDSRRV